MNITSCTLPFLIVVATLCVCATAQQTQPTQPTTRRDPPMKRTDPPASWSALPAAIPLWPGGAPGSEGNRSTPEAVLVRAEPSTSFPVIASIHNPSITPFLPAKDKATGAAVIIGPGGGHRFLAIEHEGYAVGKYLAEHGVAGFVLKYRLAKEEGSTYKIEEHALADAKRAIRLVRSRSSEWNLKPDRVGIMGFSAGGEVAALAGMRGGQAEEGSTDAIDRFQARPDFVGLIYPGNTRGFVASSSQPPHFLACAYDDRQDIAEGLAEVYLKLKQAKVPSELHIYSSGGHGFGIRPSTRPVSTWPDRFLDWLGERGFAK